MMGDEKLIVKKGIWDTKLKDSEGNTVELPNGIGINAATAYAGGQLQITLASGEKVHVPYNDVVSGLKLDSLELASIGTPFTPTNINIPEGAIRKVAEAALEKGEGR